MRKIECYVHAFRLAPLIETLTGNDELICGLWSSETKGIGATTYHDRISGSRFKTDAILMSQVTILTEDDDCERVLDIIAKQWTPGQEEGEYILVTQTNAQTYPAVGQSVL